MLDADSYTFLLASAYSVGEGDTLQVSVRSNFLSYGNSLTAYYSLVDGTAVHSSDYSGSSGSVTLTGNPADTGNATFDIPINKDNSVEGNETFTVVLTSVSEGNLGTRMPPGANTQATVTIIDSPPCVSISPSGGGSEAIDPATGNPHPIVVTLSRSGGDMDSSLGVTLQLTSGSTASAQDLSFPSVSFAPQQSYKTVQIPVVNDTYYEWQELAVIEARVTGSSAPGSSCMTTIDDNDAGLVYQNLPDETEGTPNEIDPGGVLSLNWDDDNANSQPDNLDGQQSGGAPSDDDLQPVTVTLPATYPGDIAQASFSAGQNNKVRLWLDQAKTQPVSTSPYAWADKPSTFYVEGVSPGGTAVTVTAQYGSYDYPGHIVWATPAISDTVNVTVLTAPSSFYTTLDAKNVVRLYWTDPHLGEDGFTLQWREHGTTGWTGLATVGEVETTTHTLPADYPGKSYDYRIFSISTGAAYATSGPATTTGSGIALRSIDFTGQSITRDVAQTVYSGPEWYDANCDGTISGPTPYSNGTIDGSTEHVFPVSVLRSSNAFESLLSVNVGLAYVGRVVGGWKLRGSASGYTFAAVDIPTGDVTQVSVQTSAPEALPQAIRDTEVQIAWEFSIDNGVHYFGVGSNTNRVYVTGAADGSADGAFETVLDIGCGAADGVNMRDDHLASDQRTAVDHIWGKFSGRDVTRVDGTPMTYWGAHSGPNSTATDLWDTAGLLKNADGRCGAWAKFLVSVLTAQGIASHDFGVHVIDATVTLPPRNTDTQPIAPPGCTVVYDGVFMDVNRPAQNTPSPWRYFPDHALVHIDVYADAIYDPSYGGRYSGATAEQDWQDAAISGFRYGYVIKNANGDVVDMAVGSLWVAHVNGADNVH